GMTDREVVDPPAQHRVDLRDHPLHGLGSIAAEHSLEFPLQCEARHGIEWENPQLFSVFVVRKMMAALTYLYFKIPTRNLLDSHPLVHQSLPKKSRKKLSYQGVRHKFFLSRPFLLFARAAGFPSPRPREC